MNICFVTIGDITRIATMKRALGMANPLLGLGWNVSIIAMDSPENRKRIGLECDPRIDVRYYKEGSASDEIKEKTAIVDALAPDLVYFCSYSFRNRIDKGALKVKPKIIVEHSELPSGIPDNRGLRKLAAYSFEYMSIRYADYLVCASKYLIDVYRRRSKQVFKGHIPISYSPYAFNAEVIFQPPAKLTELREKYKDNQVFLYMGTMTRNYGLFTMLDAIDIAQREGGGVKLLLMGRGRHLEEAKQYVAEKGLEDNVEFLGYVDESDLNAYFELAAAFISPLNNTVQDKARCPSKIYMYLPFEKPVFTCKIGEPKEIFGEAGYYFDNNRPDTLAGLMLDLKRAQLHNARFPIEEHSWDRRALDFHQWINNPSNTTL